MSKRRFVIFDDNQLAKKTKDSRNVNTDKAEKRADKAFRNFLKECGLEDERLDYWKLSASELDNYLAKFWFGARKDCDFSDDEDDFEADPYLKKLYYSANTLRNFRYSINRILKQKGTPFDIIAKSNPDFNTSRQAFTDALKELKKEGKGDVKSKKEITAEGLF